MAEEAGILDADEQRATIEKFLSDEEKDSAQKIAAEIPVMNWSKIISLPKILDGNWGVYWVENLSPELVDAISKCSDLDYKIPGMSWTKDFNWTAN